MVALNTPPGENAKLAEAVNLSEERSELPETQECDDKCADGAQMSRYPVTSRAKNGCRESRHHRLLMGRSDRDSSGQKELGLVITGNECGSGPSGDITHDAYTDPAARLIRYHYCDLRHMFSGGGGGGGGGRGMPVRAILQKILPTNAGTVTCGRTGERQCHVW